MIGGNLKRTVILRNLSFSNRLTKWTKPMPPLRRSGTLRIKPSTRQRCVMRPSFTFLAGLLAGFFALFYVQGVFQKLLFVADVGVASVPPWIVQVAEQAERYEEMVTEMTHVSQIKKKLSVEERNLLSVAYKNVVGAKRASWRILSALESRHEGKGENDRARTCASYKDDVEKELTEVCENLLTILSKSLLPDAVADSEAHVFYLKMKGDYYRYIAEFAKSEQKTDSQEKAKVA